MNITSTTFHLITDLSVEQLWMLTAKMCLRNQQSIKRRYFYIPFSLSKSELYFLKKSLDVILY